MRYEKEPPVPYQIRAVGLAERLLHISKNANTPEGRHILRCLEKPAASARKRLDLKGKKADPAAEDWDKAHEAALEALSKYIRTRDTWEVEGGKRVGKCITCSNPGTYESLQCGHWLTRALWGTKFHPFNNHAQCWPCNDKMRGNGRAPLHEAAIRAIHGDGAIDLLKVLTKRDARKPTAKELWAKAAELDKMREALP